MQIVFQSFDAHAQQLRITVIRRVKFAMRRLNWLAPHVSIRLSDVNGPLGGVDKRCQIEMTPKSGPPVIITSMARDWMSALQSALARATQSLLHNLKRGRPQQNTALNLPKPQLSAA